MHRRWPGCWADRTADRLLESPPSDVLRAVSHYGDKTLRMPVERLMSKPLAVVPADAFVYRAIGRMQDAPPRSGRRGGQRDRGAVCALGKALRSAMRSRRLKMVHDLARARAKLPQVVASLLAEVVSTRDVAAVISRELGALTRHAAVIAEARMRDTRQGDPLCPYARPRRDRGAGYGAENDLDALD